MKNMNKRQNKKIFGLEIEYVITFFEKVMGLMFRKKLRHALWFNFNRKTRIDASIHSFFVFFPFDVIWLNEKKIVDLRKNVKPFTFNITPKKPADSMIELPIGTINKQKLKIGKQLRF